MNFYRAFISALVLSFCALYMQAQDNGYVYRDSAIFNLDSVNAKLVDGGEEAILNDYEEGEEDEEEIFQDTVLMDNKLVLEPDSVAALKRLKVFAYAKNLDSLLFEYQKAQLAKKPGENKDRSWVESIFLSPLTQYFFWILGGLFIGFILYNLFFTQGFFQKNYAKSGVAEVPAQAESLSANTDFSKLISQAISNKNYRLAIRYHYLQLLQKLSAKGIIEIAADKTNHEYVMELGGKPYKKDFATLTLLYEYAWYGEFEIDEQHFGSIQNKFKMFNTVL